MSLKSNYSFIRDWINTKFLKKEDVDLTQYQTHEEAQDDNQYIDRTYAKKTDLNRFLTEDDEQIIAASLTDLDKRIEDLPNSGIVLGEKEEKVIAEALISLNNRVGVIENADYENQIANTGKLNAVTLNNIPAIIDNKVAKLTLESTNVGLGNVVTDVVVNGINLVVTKGNMILKIPSGTTKPNLTTNDVGYMFLDTTLSKPLWWTGTRWVDATGTTIE